MSLAQRTTFMTGQAEWEELWLGGDVTGDGLQGDLGLLSYAERPAQVSP